MQEWVSIYETCECDIEAPDIHKFPTFEGLSMDLWDKGVTIIVNKNSF